MIIWLGSRFGDGFDELFVGWEAADRFTGVEAFLGAGLGAGELLVFEVEVEVLGLDEVEA